MEAQINYCKEKEKLIQEWLHHNIITDNKVLEAFKKVPREKFLPEEYKKYAYDDHAQPLYEGQTISQPTTVILMTQYLEVKPGQKILEIGTASGYQAAILSEIVGEKGQIITTEIIESLYQFGKENLNDYKNVIVYSCDASEGYKEEAPFDRIIITCACPAIPQILIDQLKVPGILLVPVGNPTFQKMIKITKGRNKIEQKVLGEFMFVPMRGKYGFKEIAA